MLGITLLSPLYLEILLYPIPLNPSNTLSLVERKWG